MNKMTANEVAEMLGITKQRVSQLKKEERLIPTIKVERTNKKPLFFYDKEVVEKFKKINRPIGRPMGS